MLGARARQVHGEHLSYQNLKKAHAQQSYMSVILCATGKTASVMEYLFTIHITFTHDTLHSRQNNTGEIEGQSRVELSSREHGQGLKGQLSRN